MTVRLENIEQEQSDLPDEAQLELFDEKSPKKRGRPLGAKDKQKRAPRASTKPSEPEPEEPMIVRKRGRPLGAKDKTKRAARGSGFSPDPAPPFFQEQKRAYLRQLADARAADYEARAQRFAALLDKTLPY